MILRIAPEGLRSTLVCAVFVATAAASSSACSKPEAEPSPRADATTADLSPLKPMAPPLSSNGPTTLPPGHPPIFDAGLGFASQAKGDGPDIAWVAPSSWTVAPNPNAMRRATYEIPKAAGDAEGAELTVSTAGGGVEANIARWASQFGGAKPKTETRTAGPLKITTVEIEGTFGAGGPAMPGMGASAPKEHQRLLGAIVEQGELEHFFKLTGPDKTVSSAKKDFAALVASIHVAP